MDSAHRRRWAVLLPLLAATILAVVWPIEDEAPAAGVKSVRLAATVGGRTKVAEEASREWLAAEDDPFVPRGWTAPPAPEPIRTVMPVVVSEPVGRTQPQSQPLPFRFLGSMSDADDRVIYLSHGDQLLPVRQGDVIDGHYKVVAVGADRIEFEDSVSGERQSLPLPVQEK